MAPGILGYVALRPVAGDPRVSRQAVCRAAIELAEYEGRGTVRYNLSATVLTAIYPSFPHFLGWDARFLTELKKHLWCFATATVTL